MSEYSNYQLLLIFALFGIVFGFCIGIFSLLLLFLKNNKIVKIIFDSILFLLATILFITITNIFNLGQIRAYLAITFILSIFLERKIIGKLFANLYLRLYNLCKEKLNYFSKTKLGKILKK